MLHDSPLHVQQHQRLSAKATGEPPLMLAAAVGCALQDALAAAWGDHEQQQQEEEECAATAGDRQAVTVAAATAAAAGAAARRRQRAVLQLPATTANIERALP
jgi:xanthine dehydrogenase molybdopterin-binding subunit B